MSEQKIVTFLDTVGRTIIGEFQSEDEKTIVVKNPAVVNVVPTQEPGGQVKLALQLFPLFFREFLADKSENTIWRYNKSNITLSENPIIFDFKLTIQYTQLFATGQGPAPIAKTENALTPIKLFDE